MGWLLIIAGVVVAVFILFGAKLIALLPSGAAKTTLQKADTLIDKMAAAAALQTLVTLFSERGDTETVKTLGTLWVQVWAFKVPTEPTIAPTVAVQTTEGQVVQVARATNIVVETTP